MSRGGWVFLVGASLFLGLDLVVALGRLRRLRELHHGYAGLVLVAGGAGLHLFWLAAVGLLVLADDAWQHSVQAEGFLAYQSPGHRAFAWAYKRWAWVRAAHGWWQRVTGLR